MKEALCALLNDLDAVQVCYSELTDTEVREQMSAAILACFVLNANRALPKTFGMVSAEADGMVRAALMRFLCHPDILAARRERGTSEARLAAFQDKDALSGKGSDYASYFGCRSPSSLPYQLG